MQSAIDVIKDTYDYETCKEIVDHGCQSGVCSQHIYYGDTISFFDTYEEEIMDYFADFYDTEFLVNLFKDADADLSMYKNAVTWAFIEAVACDVTCEADMIDDTIEPVDKHIYHTEDGELVYNRL